MCMGAVHCGATLAQGQSLLAEPSLVPVIEEAHALAEAGRHHEALAVLDAFVGILPDAEDGSNFLALVAHTEISLEAGAWQGLGDQLRWLADFLSRHEEAAEYEGKVAHLYALWFLANGAEEAAARMLNSSAFAALGGQRPTEALNHLLSLSEVYRDGHQDERLRQTWSRIDTLLVEQGSAIVAEVAIEARVYRAEASAELRQREGVGLPPESSAAPGSVDLQPTTATAAVSKDERAQTRSILTNTSTLSITGTISIETPNGFALDWNSGGRLHRAKLIPSWWSKGGIADQREVTLPPGGEVRLYLECGPAKSGSAEATVRWQPTSVSGDVMTSKHRFIFAPDRRPTAIVHASEADWNPSYSVPIYTEIYHRALAPAVHDFKAVCDDGACRIEYFDDATGRLLAIDAEGDGDFAGDGDVLVHDVNRDRFPDITLSRENNVGAVELVVFPLPETSGTVEVALSFHTRKPSLAWKMFDANVSRMRVRLIQPGP
jgi:hypothetical protein